MLTRYISKNASLAAGIAILAGVYCVSLHAQTSATPPWLKWLGNGTNSYTCSGTCNLGEELWYTNFTVSPGATVQNPSGNGPIIIRATGTCSIQGTISNSALGANFGISGKGDFGGGGGGGGGGNAAGTVGSTTQVIPAIPLVSGGPPGAAGGGNARNAASTTINEWQQFISGGSDWPGGGGAGGQGGSNGGVGGNGGGPVILICNTIHFTGIIDVRGAAGGNSPGNNQGAGGGGGGGYVLMAAISFTAQTGTTLVTGGAGGTCAGHTNCGTGGSGGTGWAKYVTIQ